MRIACVAGCISLPGDAGTVVPGREREFLQDKDVAFLPFGPDVLQRLDMLALRALGTIHQST